MLTVLQGDVREMLATLPAEHFHCVVTSPPYWALRSYLSKGHDLKHLELGREPTPEEYVANMVGVFRAVRRVLRSDGLCFVDIGEKRAGDSNRVGVPEMLALALRGDGWVWRDTIIWAKPCPMPESVSGTRWERHRTKTGRSRRARPQDYGSISSGGIAPAQGAHAGTHHGSGFASRAEWSDCPGCRKCEATGGYVLRRGSWRCTTSHEYVLMLARSGSYFADQEAVREELISGAGEPWPGGDSAAFCPDGTRGAAERAAGHTRNRYSRPADYTGNPAGRNPRSVWTIGPEPLSEPHYAAFPSELPRRCIEVATSARGCCPKCGAQIARIVYHRNAVLEKSARTAAKVAQGLRTSVGGKQTACAETTTIRWRPTCNCPEASDPVPCRVLDPFGGAGTTGLQALRMGREVTMCELNPDYVAMARKRIEKELGLLISSGQRSAVSIQPEQSPAATSAAEE